MQEMWVQSLGQEDPLETEMAAHSSILAREIPWTEEPGGLQSVHGVAKCQIWLRDWTELNWEKHSLTTTSLQQISMIWIFLSLKTNIYHTFLSVEFSRQKNWIGLPYPPPGDLPDPGTEPTSPALAGKFFTTEPPYIWNYKAYCTCLNVLMSTDNRKRTRCHLWPDKSKITRAQNSEWWRQPLHVKCWERWKTYRMDGRKGRWLTLILLLGQTSVYADSSLFTNPLIFQKYS